MSQTPTWGGYKPFVAVVCLLNCVPPYDGNIVERGLEGWRKKSQFLGLVTPVSALKRKFTQPPRWNYPQY